MSIYGNVWPVLSFFLCVKYPFYYGKSRKGKYQVSIIFSRRVFTYKIFLKGKYPGKCLKCLMTDSLCPGELLSKINLFKVSIGKKSFFILFQIEVECLSNNQVDLVLHLKVARVVFQFKSGRTDREPHLGRLQKLLFCINIVSN